MLAFVLAFLVVLTVVLIGNLLPKLITSIKIARAVRKLPRHPKEHWFFGHTPYLIDEDGSLLPLFDDFTLPMVEKGHKIMVLSAGPGINGCHLLHPDTVKHGVGSDPKLKETCFALEQWLGGGLLTSNGTKWGRHRRLLTSAFYFDNLKSYIKVFSDCTSVLMEQWLDKGDESINVVPCIRLFTLDLLLRCICGQETNCQISRTHVPYVEAVYGLSKLTVKIVLWYSWMSDWIYSLTPMKRKYSKHCHIVHKFAMDIIKERRAQIKCRLQRNERKVEAKDKLYLDFIDVLLATKDENGQGLSDLEIREEIDTFMFAGHDTTATSLCWTLYLLAKHPEHQAKCREEVDIIFSKKADIEWDDLKNLSYLQCCIKESNRLYPPVPALGRELAEPKEIDECKLPKGTPIFMNLYAIHHNPDVWNEPELFDPSRFTHENSKHRDPLAYIPFSAGPRNCIGQNFAMAEEKVMLALVLRNFELALDETYSVKKKVYIVLHPDQLFLKLKRRF